MLRLGPGTKRGEALVASHACGFFTDATKTCKVLSTILRSPVSALPAPALYVFEFHIYFYLEQ
jgi:hypothetical protein